MAITLAQRRRLQTAKAQAAPPPPVVRGKHGGDRNREWYFSLSLEEHWKIIQRLLVARLRAEAKRKGMPQPILHTCEVAPCEGGGYVLVEGSMRPMTQEEIDAL